MAVPLPDEDNATIITRSLVLLCLWWGSRCSIDSRQSNDAPCRAGTLVRMGIVCVRHGIKKWLRVSCSTSLMT